MSKTQSNSKEDQKRILEQYIKEKQYKKSRPGSNRRKNFSKYKKLGYI